MWMMKWAHTAILLCTMLHHMPGHLPLNKTVVCGQKSLFFMCQAAREREREREGLKTLDLFSFQIYVGITAVWDLKMRTTETQ